jgi:hypothetical protein
MSTTTDAVPALKLFSDDASASTVLGTVNFRVNPPQAANLTVLRNDGQFQNDHQRLGNSQVVTVGFDLGAGPLPPTLQVRLVGLVSRLGSSDGYSPITITVNNTVIVSHFTVPGGGYNPTECSFSVPAAALRQGQNQYSIQVASDAQSFFWLYEMGVNLSPYIRVQSADMTVNPPRTSPGLAITANQGQFQNDHWRYGNGNVLAISFALDYAGTPRDFVLLSVTGLVSRLGSSDGYSPVTLSVNGQTLASNVTISGGGYNPQRADFLVPASMVHAGQNTAQLQVAADARSYFWLYRMDVTEMAFLRQVGTADVSVWPPRTVGLTITQNDGQFAGDHEIIGNNGRFTVSFPLDAPTPLIVDFVGLVSRLGDQDGYSPVTVSVNGHVIASNYTVPGGGYNYQSNPFYAARELTQAGQNTFTIQVAADARSYFWLRGATVFSA